MNFNFLYRLTPRQLILLLSSYAILIFLIVVLADGCTSQKEVTERYLQNYLAEKEAKDNLANGYAKALVLTKAEYAAQYEATIDSLKSVHSKEMARLSRIISHTRIKLIEAQTNVRIEWRDSLSLDTIRIGRTLKTEHPCINVKVFQPDNDTAAYLTYGFEIDGELFVYYGKRNKDFRIFGKRIFRYGQRTMDAKLFTNCGDSTEVNIKHIEVLDAR